MEQCAKVHRTRRTIDGATDLQNSTRRVANPTSRPSHRLRPDLRHHKGRVNGGAESLPTEPQDRLVLRSSRRRAVLLLPAGLVFVALGFLMGIRVIGFPGWLGLLARIVGWFALVFFGLAVPLALFQLLTNQSYLLLRDDGFQMYGIRKSRLVPWSEVGPFTAMTLPNPLLAPLPKWIRGPGAPKMVFFDYLPGVPSHQRLRSLNQALTGHEAGLADTYGLKAEELADLMNDWRSRFAAVLKHAAYNYPGDASSALPSCIQRLIQALPNLTK